MLSRISYTVKLALWICGLVLFCIVVLTSLNLVQVTNSLTNVGRRSINASALSLFDAIDVQSRMNKNQTLASLKYLEKNAISGVVLKGHKVKEPIKVQDYRGGATTSIQPLRIFSGGQDLSDMKLVQEVTDQYGGFAVIFEKVDGGLLPLTPVPEVMAGGDVRSWIPEGSPLYDRMLTYDDTPLIEKFSFGNQLVAYKRFHLDIDNELGGVLMVGRPLVSEDVTTLISHSTLGGEGFTLLLDKQAKVLATSEGANTDICEQSVLEDMLLREGRFSTYKDARSEYITFVKRFPEWNWFILVGMTRDNMLQHADKIFYRNNLLACLVLLVVAGLCIFIIMRFSTKPIKNMQIFAGKVAAGDYNATLDYPADDVIGRTIGAVKAMVQDLKTRLGFSNGLLAGLTFPCIVVDTEEKVTFVNQTCLDLFEYSGSLETHKGKLLSVFLYEDSDRQTVVSRAMRERTSIKDVDIERAVPSGATLFLRFNAAPLYDLDGNLIGGFLLFSDMTEAKRDQQLIEDKNHAIEASAVKAREVGDEMLSAAQELSSNITVASEGAEQQRQRATETATAMEQMNATVREVAQNASDLSSLADASMAKAREGAKAVQHLVQTIESVETQTAQLGDSMNELGTQAEGIGRIINVISDIADQTNLLALNAAIEAARAGEAGRGFAVVADEVRKLAEKTMAATGEVDSFIRSIQSSVQQSVRGTRKAVESVKESSELARLSGVTLEEIVNMVDNTSQQVRSIATAAEEQSATSQQIGQATEEVQRIALATFEAMNASESALTHMSHVINELAEVIGTMKA